MAIPPQLIMTVMQMMKNRKSNKDRIKEALAPATNAMKNNIAPLIAIGADAGNMYNLRAEDPSMRTGITTGAVGGAARGFQSGGIGGLLTGGITGALSGAIATGNVKEQKAEQDKYTYLNQMYGSVVGEDYNLQSLLYAKEGGEIVSPEGEVFVPIQTEAKKIGKKLVKEKLIFSDGTIADVNATKPHSEQKKDDVTDIAVEGTYVMPVSTKLSKKDLDSLISYSTSKYSENGKNFAVEKVTLRDILGEKFEGSFAEATDIVTKKYPVMDTEDDLDPIARITNSENIANRSKIIAHLMRLNEAKINKEPIEETKLTPSMKAKVGGYIKNFKAGGNIFGGGDPGKPEKIKIEDKRKIRATTNKEINPNVDLLTGEYDKDTIVKIIGLAKKHGVDERDALAVAYKETMFGKTDNNIGHIIGDSDIKFSSNDAIENYIELLKYKTGEYSDRLGIPKDDRKLRLQSYNGLGVVRPKTEKRYHGYEMQKIYGVDLTDEGIDMKKNPLYGIEIDDIKENILKKNKVIDDLINNTKPWGAVAEPTYSEREDGEKIISTETFIDFNANKATHDVDVIKKKKPIDKKHSFTSSLVKMKKGGYVQKYVLGSIIKRSVDPTNPTNPTLPKTIYETMVRLGEVPEFGSITNLYSEEDFYKLPESEQSSTWKTYATSYNKTAKKPEGKIQEVIINPLLTQVDKEEENITQQTLSEQQRREVAYADAVKQGLKYFDFLRDDGTTTKIQIINDPNYKAVKQTQNPVQKTTKNTSVRGYAKNILKRGGIVRHYAVGGIVGPGDPPKGKKYQSKNGTIIVGDDGKYYFGKKDGSYIEANPQTVQMFKNQLDGSKKPSGGNNPWLLVENSTSKKNPSTNSKDTEWISQILDFESTSGSASGTGLKNYGIKRDKWGEKYKYLDKDEISREDATRFIEEEYLSKVKDYPPDVQKRLVDYAYNTGRNIEDVLMHASGLVDTQSVQTKNTDYDLFEKNKDQIIKNMQDPNFISKIDQSKHDILKDYWERKGNPSAYKDTSAKRIDMWTNRENTKVEPIDSKKLDPIYSMESMDTLGTPIYKPKPTQSTSIQNNNIKSTSRYYSPIKTNQELTPTDIWFPNTYTPQSTITPEGTVSPTAATNNNTQPNNAAQTSKYTPKGGYYIPGENKNRYDRDTEGNWYIQKNDGKTWIPASELPNSAEAIKRLNEESKEWNTSDNNNKPTASSSLVKPKTNTSIPEKVKPAPTPAPTSENTTNTKPLQDKKGNYTYSVLISDPWLKNYSTPRYQEDLATRIDAGIISPEEAKKIQEAAQKKGYYKPAKMAKGGYIKKMAGGGPIVPIIPERWRDIWAIDETGHQPYYPMPGMVSNPYFDMSPITGATNPVLPASDNNPYGIGVPVGTPREDDNPYGIGKQVGTPRADTTTPDGKETLNEFQDLINKRRDEATKAAEASKKGYKDLNRRVGMRDLLQLGTGIAGIGIQDRTEKRAFKRPLYIDQKYRGLSPQQINQESEAATGAGVETVKQMLNAGGDRVTARLAPVLIDRLISNQGKIRKSYVDQNIQMERNKYAERGAIQQFNLDEDVRASRVEQDNTNKAISGTASLINKYTSSRNENDMSMYKVNEGIGRDLTDKLYKLDNQGVQVDMIGKDYDMQINDVKQRMADIEAELTRTDIDAVMKEKLQQSQEAHKRYLQELEKQKIRNNIR